MKYTIHAKASEKENDVTIKCNGYAETIHYAIQLIEQGYVRIEVILEVEK